MAALRCSWPRALFLHSPWTAAAERTTAAFVSNRRLFVSDAIATETDGESVALEAHNPKPASTKASVDRSTAQSVVLATAQSHGVSTPSLASRFPSPALKFKIVSACIAETNVGLFSNPILSKIKSLGDLVDALSGEGFAKPKSLLEQSYDMFNKVDTVEALFERMERENTRPPNLYLRPKSGAR
ncbi:hypothetical protein HDU83_009651 [Entophlyctis luteolus]|nr:hypothetical protein HDU82_005818 [Entophlyctis luteolus]KAJ3356839.1 hypothetical protein HDU83_009651 [Entophlyctis luteolus]KAJ3393987.1 hypothetical protein HDU84_000486 [Entophlyctis sp. JEL0112]